MKKWKQYDIIAAKQQLMTSFANEPQALNETSMIRYAECALPLWAYALVFIFGGIYYCFLEALFRGYTHWTMGVTGGACFLGLFFISIKGRKQPLLLLCLEGSLLITVLEFTVGCVVNLVLGWHVWDYSSLHFHLLGQISLLYSIVWFFLCIPGIRLCRIFYALLLCDVPAEKELDIYETQIR